VTEEISVYKVEVQDGASVPSQVCAFAHKTELHFLPVSSQIRYTDDIIMPHLQLYSRKYEVEFIY